MKQAYQQEKVGLNPLAVEMIVIGRSIKLHIIAQRRCSAEEMPLLQDW